MDKTDIVYALNQYVGKLNIVLKTFNYKKTQNTGWYLCFFLELNVYIHEDVSGVTFVICGVTSGLLIFASSTLIYKELGWESLAERRKRTKLQMFYNIQNVSLWLNSTINSKYNRLSIA